MQLWTTIEKDFIRLYPQAPNLPPSLPNLPTNEERSGTDDKLVDSNSVPNEHLLEELGESIALLLKCNETVSGTENECVESNSEPKEKLTEAETNQKQRCELSDFGDLGAKEDEENSEVNEDEENSDESLDEEKIEEDVKEEIRKITTPDVFQLFVELDGQMFTVDDAINCIIKKESESDDDKHSWKDVIKKTQIEMLRATSQLSRLNDADTTPYREKAVEEVIGNVKDLLNNLKSLAKDGGVHIDD